jgi:hypothetical protein
MTDRVRAQFPSSTLESNDRRPTVIARSQASGLFQGWGPKL